VQQPVLSSVDMEKIRCIAAHTDGNFRSQTFSICYAASQGAAGMAAALQSLCAHTEQAVREGCNILILSDREVDQDHIAIPALLATSAAHHHLVDAGLRTSTGLVIETGSTREVHHYALLAGYGAEAIHPYLAFETLADLRGQLPEDLSHAEMCKRYIKAIDKGLLKVMSKMGISTYQSYCGAQIFEAVGLSSAFLDKYFAGTASKIEGIGCAEIAEEAVRWHREAYSDAPLYRDQLDPGGRVRRAHARRSAYVERRVDQHPATCGAQQ